MLSILRILFSTGDFMPHGQCYLWDPALVRLHLLSDLAIGLAYVAISFTLVRLVRRSRGEIPFPWMFLAFGLFIVSCGGTHLMEVWTLWTPVYWLSGSVKVVTALASVVTAIALPPLVPRSLRLLQAAREADRRQKELEKLYHQLEDRSQRRAHQLAAIVESSEDAVVSKDLDGIIQSWNAGAERVYGYAEAEAIGRPITIVVPPDRAAEEEEILGRLRRGERLQHFETLRRRKDGSLIPVSLTVSPLRDRGGNVIGASHIARDISERHAFQEKLLQTQKLESLGVLAGGVAHDFNNLLTGILGNASLALDEMPSNHRSRRLLEDVVRASQSAADLTRQLLAYAGKGRFVTEPVDLSALVREIQHLLQTSIPRNVHVRLELADGLPVVEADLGQMQQLVMNLVINGAEAIGEDRAGTVLVTTGVQEIDREYIRMHPAEAELAPGVYVALEVHDTGSGMDEAVRARIFDPFFTTKFTGRGLGLSAALGIVRGHKGAMRVDSAAGQGSTFKVLLPATTPRAMEGSSRRAIEDLRGEGTILVVDDESVVRGAARNALEHYGYTVLLAEDGVQAVEIFREQHDRIALVLLDLTMPVMSGEECLRRLQQIRPGTYVLLSSGFNEVEAVRRFAGKGLAGFIQKPYAAAELARRVKVALGKTSA